MPPRKKNIVTTEAWPALRKGRLYEVRIKSAAPDKAAGFLEVTIENLDPAQLGRIHKVNLRLPIRPGNRACTFLAACGVDATAAGTTVDLDRIASVIVGMRVRTSDVNGFEEFDFERISTAPATARTDPSAEKSAEKKHTREHDLDGRRNDSQ
jgi:hypothetical protein